MLRLALRNKHNICVWNRQEGQQQREAVRCRQQGVAEAHLLLERDLCSDKGEPWA